jgi:uncharacterized protein (TIGR01777 family)
MPKVLITGGSGLIGKELTELLLKRNYEVAHLSRSENLSGKVKAYKWNVEKKEIDLRAFEDLDYIVHLAGTGVADKRWTEQRKQEIIDSRVNSSVLLSDTLKKAGTTLKGFVGASAVGIYGMSTSDHIYKEEDNGTDDFLSQSCRLWEQSYKPFEEAGIRVVKIRVGVVLSKKGGALIKMLGPVKLGIGSSLGSGKQYVPWIHIADICGIFLMAIEDEKMTGVYNGVAPNAVTNDELTRDIARTIGKPYFMPAVPVFVLKMMFGERSAIFLQGSAVSAQKIIRSGYGFKFATVETALSDLLAE